MRRRPALTAIALAALALPACSTRTGEAVVVEKEQIAAAEPKPSATSSEDKPVPAGEPELREMADDEIAVNGLVMKRADRGTGRDPRAKAEEQWILRLELSDGAGSVSLPVTREQYASYEVGARVRVKYRVGNYTKTVWGADIIER